MSPEELHLFSHDRLLLTMFASANDARDMVRRTEELVEGTEHQAARQAAPTDPARGYAQFLNDIVAATKRFGFRVDRSPSRDPRLRGFRGG